MPVTGSSLMLSKSPEGEVEVEDLEVEGGRDASLPTGAAELAAPSDGGGGVRGGSSPTDCPREPARRWPTTRQTLWESQKTS